MSKIVKYIISKTYKPLLAKYLSGTRTCFYKNIILEVPSEVFHPDFFHSTRLLLRHIEGLQIKQRSFLELGAGSGLIAMYAAQKGAYVTATDINPVAIEYLYKNKTGNNVDMHIIHSDLFKKIPKEAFDIIAINPPYYKKDPVTNADYAWYCGRNGEYFKKLFPALGGYIHRKSKVLMSLCEGCDIEMVKAIAGENNFSLNLLYQKKSLVERNYIFGIGVNEHIIKPTILS
ncbi:MAG TPA: methyltransferase [Chitinophagaceae bacterium]|nr:methyltransferase [Chitinophagaceae bacterium]